MSLITWVGNAGNGLWQTPANWDTETVPDTGDDVLIPDGWGEIGGTPPNAVQSVTVEGNSILNLLGPLTATNFVFYGTSYNSGTITGDCAFYDNSANNSGTITGDCTFNNSSANNGTITGDCTFNDTSVNNSGSIYGAAIFLDGSSIGGYEFYGPVDMFDNSWSVGGYFYDNLTLHDSSFIASAWVGGVLTFSSLAALQTSLNYHGLNNGAFPLLIYQPTAIKFPFADVLGTGML